MLWIDGQEVVRATTPNETVDAALELEQGLHDIRIRFADRTDHTHINVYWTPPGAARQILPAEILYPPQDDYASVVLPALSSLVPPLPPIEGPTPPMERLPGTVNIVATDLAAPRGVAVAQDGRIVVAEGDAGRVRVLAPTGEELAIFPSDGSLLVDPSDVAVDYDRAYVLEAGAAKLHWFMLDGSDRGQIDVNPIYVDRARGLFVAADSAIWIANTPSGNIVEVGATGLVDVIPVFAGEEPQPSDLAIGADGRFFVADAGNARFVRLSPTGQRERIWFATESNTVDSPHLAVDAAGALYLTVPEAGRVLKLTPDGEPIWLLGSGLDHGTICQAGGHCGRPGWPNLDYRQPWRCAARTRAGVTRIGRSCEHDELAAVWVLVATNCVAVCRTGISGPRLARPDAGGSTR